MNYNTMTIESLSEYIFVKSEYKINKADTACRIQHLIDVAVEKALKEALLDI